MPAYDETRWVVNEDGSRSRISVDPATYLPAEPEVEEDESDEIDATDGAIALAEEEGLDLSTVTGTGADGRITKADVEAALA